MEQMRTLYVYELKKIVCRKLVWMTAGIMLFLCVLLGFADLLGTSFAYSEGGEDESVTISGYEMMKIEREYARKLSGRDIDDTLLQEMQEYYAGKGDRKEISESTDLETGTQTVVSTGDVEEERVEDRLLERKKYMPILYYVYWIMQDIEQAYITDAAGLYSEREQLIDQSRADQMLTEGELDYWKERDGNVKVPFSYAYMDGWKNIWDQAAVINCMLLLFLAVSLANAFSVEHQRRTDAIILCSQYGKKKLYFAKMLAGITFGGASALLLFGTAAISNLIVYGADGFSGALQIAFPLCSWSVSIGKSVMILFFLVLFISVLYSIAIMFLSEWLKKSVGVMAVPVGMMIFTLFVQIPYRFRSLSQIYTLLPTNILMRQELWDDRLFFVLGKYMTNFQMAPVVYILISLLLFVMGKRIYQKYQVGA